MPSNKRPMRASVCALILPFILTGCASLTNSSARTSAPNATRVACQSFQPIYWGKGDTDKTVAQVKEHNAAGKALCGWGAKQ